MGMEMTAGLLSWVLVIAPVLARSAPARPVPVAAEVNESVFRKTLQATERRLQPMVQRRFGAGKRLVVTGDWRKEYSPDSPGGSFYHPDIPGVAYENRWGIHISGWTARWPGFDSDTVQVILCHELGHHFLGGGDEVGADHWTPDCLRTVWSAAETDQWIRSHGQGVPTEVVDACQGTPAADRSFCQRVMINVARVQAFRAAIWRRLGLSDESEIRQSARCRQRAWRAGVLGQPRPGCNS